MHMVDMVGRRFDSAVTIGTTCDWLDHPLERFSEGGTK
jgi:hypothetical protein